jgi:protein SCO1/2
MARHRRRGRAGRTAVALLAVTALAAGGACGSDEGDDAASEASPATLQGLTRPEPLAVGELALPVAATGEPRPLRAAPGELLAVYFGYLSCPDVCPTTMADLESALAELDPDDAERVEVAFVTVDPERDDAERLDSYLDHFFDRYQGLRTEDPAELARVEDAFLATSALTPDAEGGYDVTHSATTYVVDEAGTVLVEWAFGTPADVMAADLAILLDDRPVAA